jgi:hypothetical protein
MSYRTVRKLMSKVSAAPAHSGDYSGNCSMRCSNYLCPCRSPAPAALVHLTSMDGGNAVGLWEESVSQRLC